MKRIPHQLAYPLSLSVLILGGISAHADLFSALAVDNATVQVEGPRPGDNGKRFFNMEGNQNGDCTVEMVPPCFASFGVADFDSDCLQIRGEIESIRSLTVTFVQANASFTHDGALHFWLTTDTTTDIQPSEEDPAIKFALADDPDGLADQLIPRFFLGDGTFTQVEDGHPDPFSFPLSRQAERYLVRQIRHHGTIRIGVSPADGAVAATYAGHANDEFSGPLITLDVERDD
jgi:hypothetical protein